MAFPILRLTIFPLVRFLFIKNITGLETLPKKGRYIIASNHASYADAPLLFATIVSVINRPIHFVSWKRVQYWPLIGKIAPYFGAIFENGSMDKLLEKLKRGCVVGIYPEGGRTHTGKIQKVTHTGTGVLAAVGNAPVIPVKTAGTYELWPYNKTFPKITKTIEIRIGKPIRFTGKRTRKNYLSFGNKVMNIIERL